MVKFLLISLVLAGLLWGALLFVKKEIRTPMAAKAPEAVFQVHPGESGFSIAERLERKEIVKSRYLFLLYLLPQRRYRRLKAGVYTISPSMSPAEIGKKMERGEVAKIKVTIPEGLRSEEIEKRFEKKTGNQFDLNQNKEKFEPDFPFLKNIPDKKGLEGFLFPDTYFITSLDREKKITEKMLSNFSQKALPVAKNTERKIFDIIIMASLLEKEVRGLEGKRVASGILWKRWEAGMPLEVDATITYLTGKHSIRVSAEEKNIDSPYNTYRYSGLPPGPICNPGLESIKAATNPKKTDYWYYLTTLQGKLIPSQTLAQHKKAKQKYLK